MRSKMLLIFAVAALLASICGCEPGFFITVYFLTRPKPPKKLTLTIISDCGEPKPAVGTHRYKKGSTITASCGTTPYPSDAPASGTRFVCDGFNASGSNLPAASSATSTTFKLTTDTTITWLWHKEHKVTVAIDPSTINATVYRTPDSDWIADNTQLTLFASSSEPDYVFDRWIVGTDEYTDNPLQITITAPVLVIAKFRQQATNTVTLTVDSAYDTPVPDDTTTWNVGDTITAYVSEPIVDDGQPTRYRCVGWTGTGSVPSSGSGTSVTFTIDQDSTLTWNWQTQHKLTVEIQPAGVGSVSFNPLGDNGYFDEGTDVEVTATATDPNYAFLRWDGAGGGSQDNPITITMDAPKTLIAVFAEKPKLTRPDLPYAPTMKHYRQLLWVEGGQRPYTFSVSNGSLPNGLSLDPSTGIIEGTPDTDGTYTFEVTVTDSNGFSDTKQYTITVERDWTKVYPVNSPCERDAPLMAFDRSSGKVFLFGGGIGYAPNYVSYDDTWEYDGYEWRQIQVSGPPARRDGGLVYDEKRNRFILFGGWDQPAGTYYGDTWEYKNGQWTQLFPAHSPGARRGHIMVYDAKRDRIVLSGGENGTDDLNDTWEFDGTDWHQVNTAHAPSPRRGAAACYDRYRGVVVLFGGGQFRSGTGWFGDTWVYDGSDWTQLSPSTSPSARGFCGMAYDEARAVVMLFGGWDSAAAAITNELWMFDGTNWSQVNTPTQPDPVENPGFIYDCKRACFILFGGHASQGVKNTLWRYDGSDWLKRYPVPHPSARAYAGMTWSPNNNAVLLFGGDAGGGSCLNDTWLYKDGVWTQLSPAHAPPSRGCWIALDPSTNQILLFGGIYPAGNDTWLWDGTDWIQQSPTTTPPGRHRHGYCYFPWQQRIVVGPGYTGNGTWTNADMWGWNGSDWQKESFTAAFGVRCDYGMTYDENRSVIVVFGGSSGGTTGWQDICHNDIWEFDGTGWIDVTPSSGSAPVERNCLFQGSLIYFPPFKKIILFGGRCRPGGTGTPCAANDMWMWDGSTWTELHPRTTPCARCGAPMAYDRTRKVLVLFGGSEISGNRFDDTWEY